MGESLPQAAPSAGEALSGANVLGVCPFPASTLPMPTDAPNNASIRSELFRQLADVLPDPALVDMMAPLGVGSGRDSSGVPAPGKSAQPRPRKTTEHPNAINRHQITCHHPPYRVTHCDGALGNGLENLQGVGKNRVSFLCHKCLAADNVDQARWSQLVEKVEGDPDPVIRKSEKLSPKERAMPDACLRGAGYKCGKCGHPKVFNADLALYGVLFCQCPPCPICKRKSCKCQKSADMLGNGLLPSLPDLPALAPVPPRSMMVGGGSKLSESRQTFSVACAIASAQNAIAQVTDPPPAKVVPASARPLLAQAVAPATTAAPASAPATTAAPASAPATTAPTPVALNLAPPASATNPAPASVETSVAPARAVRVSRSLPRSVVPGSSRAFYGGKPCARPSEASAESDSDAAAEDDDADAAEDDADANDEPPKDSVAPNSAFRTVEGVFMPFANDDADAKVSSPAPTPSAVPSSAAPPVAPSVRKRKAMKPIAGRRPTKAAATPCEVCSKPGSSIRCKHKGCTTCVCSALCGGYRNDANMKWAGGWACTQHMASPDDHAWYCPTCSKMVTDRTDDDEIGVIIPSVGCDKCASWYCLECVGMHKRKRLSDPWFCGKC